MSVIPISDRMPLSLYEVFRDSFGTNTCTCCKGNISRIIKNNINKYNFQHFTGFTTKPKNVSMSQISAHSMMQINSTNIGGNIRTVQKEIKAATVRSKSYIHFLQTALYYILHCLKIYIAFFQRF
uniref:Uncharacterized protein n=1 Tax=Anguilla anguilla TaxID=7936 RepID=A0A0E9WQL7_ANGAN